MSLRFACTSCGRCCHDLRLPLSISEALRWLDRGGTVEILADAAPQIGDADADPNLAAGYRRERALRGRSGTLPILINLTLVATFSGACPNLLPSMRCGAYDVRPNTCRIFPAELLPGRVVDPASKACPPEAWNAQVGAGGAGPLESDTSIDRAIRAARDASLADVPGKQNVARMLGIKTVGLSNEGLVVHRRPSAALKRAIEIACKGAFPRDDERSWRFASPTPEIRRMVVDAGAELAKESAWSENCYIAL